MDKKHKIFSLVIVSVVTLTSYFLKIQMTDMAARGLVLFFSVVFGFYITSISTLYKSAYAKDLHKNIDKGGKKRYIHILGDYLTIFGYWLILSIVLIIIFAMLDVKIPTYWTLDIAVDSILFGISALNVFYMILMLNLFINGMIEESSLDD